MGGHKKHWPNHPHFYKARIPKTRSDREVIGLDDKVYKISTNTIAKLHRRYADPNSKIRKPRTKKLSIKQQADYLNMSNQESAAFAEFRRTHGTTHYYSDRVKFYLSDLYPDAKIDVTLKPGVNGGYVAYWYRNPANKCLKQHQGIQKAHLYELRKDRIDRDAEKGIYMLTQHTKTDLSIAWEAENGGTQQ